MKTKTATRHKSIRTSNFTITQPWIVMHKQGIKHHQTKVLPRARIYVGFADTKHIYMWWAAICILCILAASYTTEVVYDMAKMWKTPSLGVAQSWWISKNAHKYTILRNTCTHTYPCLGSANMQNWSSDEVSTLVSDFSLFMWGKFWVNVETHLYGILHLLNVFKHEPVSSVTGLMQLHVSLCLEQYQTPDG